MATSRSSPSEEELAAIVAAYEVLRPRAVVAAEADDGAPPAWRFSGRWWSRPIPARRIRP